MFKIAGRESCLRFIVCLFVLAALFTANTPAMAETAAGRIAGVIKDPSGALVPGGQITIKNLDSGAAKSTTTDQQGRYVFDAVPAGRYEVSATAPGFAAAVRNDVTVVAGGNANVTFDLSISRSTTFVSVTESDHSGRFGAQLFQRGPEPAMRHPYSATFLA